MTEQKKLLPLYNFTEQGYIYRTHKIFFEKRFDSSKKFLTFVKQFGEMVGTSVKPWFPNLEKKTKKDLVN